MNELIGPVEMGIFVFIAFVLPTVIMWTDNHAWHRSNRGEQVS